MAILKQDSESYAIYNGWYAIVNKICAKLLI